MPRTHYEVLGVSPNASAEEIKRAFRAAARRLHPDVSSSTDADQRFAHVSAAYEVLSDPEARRDYDQSLAAKASGGDRDASDVGQPHYSWTNVATHATPAGDSSQPGKADLDEMYNAFFGQSAKRKPKA